MCAAVPVIRLDLGLPDGHLLAVCFILLLSSNLEYLMTEKLNHLQSSAQQFFLWRKAVAFTHTTFIKCFWNMRCRSISTTLVYQVQGLGFNP